MKSNDFIDKFQYSTVFLLDMSWHLYRNAYVFSPDKFFVEDSGVKIPTGHIYGFIKTIMMILSKFNNPLIVVCKDGFPVRRHELMGSTVYKDDTGRYVVEGVSYKAGRQDPPFDFYKDSKIIEELISVIPNTVMAYREDLESDDLMFSLAKDYAKKGSSVYIYSGDDDLLQAIDSSIWVVRHVDSNTKAFVPICEEDVIKSPKYGVLPSQLPIYRSLVGDHSDHIEGIAPRFPRYVIRMVAESVSLPEEVLSKDFESYNGYDSLSKSQKVTFVKKLNEIKERYDVFVRNFKLMKLGHQDFEIYRKRSERIKELVTYYNLNSYRQYLYRLGVIN